MGFQAFIKFALICLDSLSWPLFALGYPLRASIHAIETNSNSDTKKLVTYWVIFSLISLFEHAFMGMLQWLPFWPYMKLTIVCWMMIPHFDGAFYVYNHFVHPCLNVDMRTITNWFKKFQEFFSKDLFLAEADKYAKAHRLEALEKPIASEGANSSILQKDMKAVQVTEKREVGTVNLIPEIEPNAAQTVNDVITVSEMKGEEGFDRPEIPPDKQQVQKEWTCAMCQVTTTSETTLNSHLLGRRHRDACEELMKAKSQPSKGKVSYTSVVKAKHSDISHEEPFSSATQASQKKQQPSNGQVSASSVANNSDLPSSNTSKSSKAVNPNAGTSKSNPPKEEPTKSIRNNSAGNQLKPSESVKCQQNVGKKPQFRCSVCNVYCSRSEDLNYHLWGKKHSARIQELNSLGGGELA